MNRFYKLLYPIDCLQCFNKIKWYQEIEYGHNKFYCKKCGYVWEENINIIFSKEELDDYADLLGMNNKDDFK
jgi:transposase-like protein